MKWIILILLSTPVHAQTAIKVSLASDHYSKKNPEYDHCRCSREDFVEKNWGLGFERFTETYRVRDYSADMYIYTDSFGKPAGFIGRGKEYRIMRSPIWVGYRYGISSRHDMSDWVPIPMGYGTATLRLYKVEAAMIIIPQVVIGFSLRVPL